ncbi:MAG TPA: CAP domain-containing protein, partial [Opitutus sp.]|nr:CAP domain-containing protein [Opitutus sp.]
MHLVSRLVFLLLCTTPLWAQIPYSIDGTSGPPTDEETFYLELINRARANPTAEGERLRTTTDTTVLAAVDFFDTDLNLMAQEMSALPPAPPIAFNAKLTNAARAHSLDQFTHQFQGHVGSNGSDGVSRVTAAGYSFQTFGENVYATASSVFYGHAGFEIDWGNNDIGGMQAGRGHRLIIHKPDIREVGIGVVLGTNGTVGPQVVTQDFGTQLNATPLLTGVAYYDLSGDNFYTPGEGLGGINVTVSNATFSAVTSPSGAFTVPLPGDGIYNVRFSG